MTSPAENNDLRESIIVWLTANDIDVTAIPIEPRASLDGDQLTIDVWTRTADGSGWVRGSPDGDAARMVTTFTIAVPPPDDVADWLKPQDPPRR